MKKILFLSIFLFVTGCSDKKVEYIRPVTFPLKIYIPQDTNFTLYKKDGKICMSVSEFKKLTNNYVRMKNELIRIKKAVQYYNQKIAKGEINVK